MIIVEGADNSGKSTFAHRIGLTVYPAGPAPKTPDEEKKCLTEQRARSHDNCVSDRVTCISQQVYGGRLFDRILGEELIDMITVPSVVVVYCRPPNRVLMDMSTHKVKGYDTEEHLQKIMDNQHVFIERYDSLMSTIPHVVYDWTDNEVYLPEFINLVVNSQYERSVWNRLCKTTFAKI